MVVLHSLNKVAIPDNYPLPLQAEVIQSLRGKRFISVIDATAFFHLFEVHSDFRDRFTMISHRGLERSTVALMGFRNSSAYAQRYMDTLLEPHKDYCRAFIDDIVIFSGSEEEHFAHLSTIFELFSELGISISAKKSFLAYPSVELLGFRVDAFGLSTTTDRIAAFKNLVFPAQLISRC